MHINFNGNRTYGLGIASTVLSIWASGKHTEKAFFHTSNV